MNIFQTRVAEAAIEIKDKLELTQYWLLLQRNQWVFALILTFCVLYILITLFRIWRQKKNESNIMNLFNDDGSKNEHLGHRTYHLVTPLFITVIISFVWYLVQIVNF